MSPEDLDAQLLDAHQRNDWDVLTKLYRQAAAISEAAGQIEEACFRYTQAYVYALQCGASNEASEIHKILVAHGREE